MFALIVNAFHADDKGRKQFGALFANKSILVISIPRGTHTRHCLCRPSTRCSCMPAAFESAVTDALTTCGEKVSIQSRRYDDLDSYLFLPDEGFRQDYSAKQFDKVDMIFIGTASDQSYTRPVSYSHFSKQPLTHLYIYTHTHTLSRPSPRLLHRWRRQLSAVGPAAGSSSSTAQNVCFDEQVPLRVHFCLAHAGVHVRASYSPFDMGSLFYSDFPSRFACHHFVSD